MERTEHITDALLRRILTEPSIAARIITATADTLDGDPHLNINEFAIGYAASIGSRMVTDGVPEIVADESIRAAARALPGAFPGETCGEYAIRLRDTARSL